MWWQAHTMNSASALWFNSTSTSQRTWGNWNAEIHEQVQQSLAQKTNTSWFASSGSTDGSTDCVQNNPVGSKQWLDSSLAFVADYLDLRLSLSDYPASFPPTRLPINDWTTYLLIVFFLYFKHPNLKQAKMRAVPQKIDWCQRLKCHAFIWREWLRDIWTFYF